MKLTRMEVMYVMSEEEVEESDKVKIFDKFIEDLRRLLKEP